MTFPVGWQVRREYFQPELTRAEAALSLAPGVSFYTLSMGERTVGQATSRLDTIPEGFALEDVMILDLPALGQTGLRSPVFLSHSLVITPAGDLPASFIIHVALQRRSGIRRGARRTALRCSGGKRLTGVELSGFQLDGGRQTLSGDTLTVRPRGLGRRGAQFFPSV